MFTAKTVWRGIVYTILMLFGKLVTGAWLIQLNLTWPKLQLPKSVRATIGASASCFSWMYGRQKKEKVNSHELKRTGKRSARKGKGRGVVTAPAEDTNRPSTAKINKPLSLYPAAMLGTAMTARGEIGFLIASLAETTGLFASPSGSDTGSSKIYLVVTWAIVLCTIIGPLSVGTLVRRVRRLQSAEESNSGTGGPLGAWGIG